MGRIKSDVLWGGLLIGAGVLFLLQTLGVIGNLNDLVWAALFAGAGGVFLVSYATNRETNWWAAIPGLALAAIGVVIFMSVLGLDDFGGVLILAAIALSFWLVYLSDTSRWWAIIPGGVMLSVTGLVFYEDVLNGRNDELGAGLMLVGMGATFVALYFLPTGGEKRMSWALIPGGVLAIIGFILAVSSAELFGMFWALALIGGGIYLLTKRGQAQLSDEQAEPSDNR